MLDRVLWYFAYGSNLDPTVFEARRKIRPAEACVARLDGWRLVFDLPVGPGERAVANVRPDALADVHGVAYAISNRDARHLDRTEGVHRGYYKRIAIELVTREEDRLAAFTYVSPHGRSDRKPSARYMGLILRGARHHGLPADYIAWLESLDLAADEREQRARHSGRPG
jgi:cation transport regulator ChaC